MNEEFERIMEFQPAYDKRHPDPSKNYGIHGVEIKFLLKKDNKAVQFNLYTHWQLPHVTDERLAKSTFDEMDIRAFWMPMPSDLGYHSPYQVYEGQTPISANCPYIDGDCYYDGSTLNAKPVYEILLREGGEGVWKHLEEYYAHTFGNNKGEMS